MHNELQLARAEISVKVSEAISGVGLVVGAGIGHRRRLRDLALAFLNRFRLIEVVFGLRA
jgi:hypothetical protein